MTKQDIYIALENMEVFGGSFIQSLAICYKKADPINKGILFNAFKHFFKNMQLLKMTKEEAENFIYKCLVDNESKKDPKEKLTRLDICDILHTDFEIPKSTAYRYYKDTFNLYKWEQAKPDPLKKIKDTKDTILDSVLDEAESLLADGDSVGYFKGIELYSKLLTRFKKV